MKKKIVKNPLANLFYEAGILNKTPRTGFRHLGRWYQSVGEHTFRTVLIAYSIAEIESKNVKEVNIEKVITMSLFHDFAEARTLDLDYISQKYTKADEEAALIDAVKELPFGKHIEDLFKEYEERETLESVIAKEADILELLCSIQEVTEEGNKLAQSWVPTLLKRLKTKTGKKLAKEIMNTKPDDWWYFDKEDEFWVTGGKRRK